MNLPSPKIRICLGRGVERNITHPHASKGPLERTESLYEGSINAGQKIMEIEPKHRAKKSDNKRGSAGKERRRNGKNASSAVVQLKKITAQARRPPRPTNDSYKMAGGGRNWKGSQLGQKKKNADIEVDGLSKNQTAPKNTKGPRAKKARLSRKESSKFVQNARKGSAQWRKKRWEARLVK